MKIVVNLPLIMFIAVNASMIGKINEILDTVKMTPAQIKGSNDTKINDSSYPSLQKINNTPNVSTKNLVNALGNKGGFASSFSSGLSMNLRNQENPNGVVGAAPIHNQIATNLRRNSTENLLSEIKSYCLKSFMGTQASKDVSSTTGPDISLKNGDADQLTSSLKGSTINQLASLLQSTIGIHSNNKISNIQNEQPSTPKGSANNTLLVSNVVKTLSPGQSVSLLSERLKKEGKMDARKALVQFYSDHCVHCRDMKESIKAVETKYKHDATVIVTRVDGNIESSLADSENIRGYPTINIYTSDPITGTWRFRKECDGRKTDEMISCIENV